MPEVRALAVEGEAHGFFLVLGQEAVEHEVAHLFPFPESGLSRRPVHLLRGRARPDRRLKADVVERQTCAEELDGVMGNVVHASDELHAGEGDQVGLDVGGVRPKYDLGVRTAGQGRSHVLPLATSLPVVNGA